MYWLASYPKSGNTWVRLVLRHLLQGDDFRLDAGRESASAFSRSQVDSILGLPSAHLAPEAQQDLRPAVFRAMAQEQGRFLVVKIHDAFHRTPAGGWLCPPEITSGAIHLVRNPLDVAVSLAFHADGSIAQAVDFLCDESAVIADETHSALPMLRQVLGDWSGHVRSWLAAPVPRLVLRYEDMVAEPVPCFTRIVDFLGLERGRERIAEAVAACRFDTLQQIERKAGFSERRSTRSPFFRAGRPGDWREHLDAESLRRLIDSHGTIMQELGYDIPRVE